MSAALQRPTRQPAGAAERLSAVLVDNRDKKKLKGEGEREEGERYYNSDSDSDLLWLLESEAAQPLRTAHVCIAAGVLSENVRPHFVQKYQNKDVNSDDDGDSYDIDDTTNGNGAGEEEQRDGVLRVSGHSTQEGKMRDGEVGIGERFDDSVFNGLQMGWTLACVGPFSTAGEVIDQLVLAGREIALLAAKKAEKANTKNTGGATSPTTSDGKGTETIPNGTMVAAEASPKTNVPTSHERNLASDDATTGILAEAVAASDYSSSEDESLVSDGRDARTTVVRPNLMNLQRAAKLAERADGLVHANGHWRLFRPGAVAPLLLDSKVNPHWSSSRNDNVFLMIPGAWLQGGIASTTAVNVMKSMLELVNFRSASDLSDSLGAETAVVKQCFARMVGFSVLPFTSSSDIGSQAMQAITRAEKSQAAVQAQITRIESASKGLIAESSSEVTPDEFIQAARANRWVAPPDDTAKAQQFVLVSDEGGLSALHWFASYDNRSAVRKILRLPDGRSPAVLNARDIRGLTPLHHAAQSRHPKMIKLLLENGSDPLLLTHSDESATMLLRRAIGEYGSSRTRTILDAEIRRATAEGLKEQKHRQRTLMALQLLENAEHDAANVLKKFRKSEKDFRRSVKTLDFRAADDALMSQFRSQQLIDFNKFVAMLARSVASIPIRRLSAADLQVQRAMARNPVHTSSSGALIDLESGFRTSKAGTGQQTRNAARQSALLRPVLQSGLSVYIGKGQWTSAALSLSRDFLRIDAADTDESNKGRRKLRFVVRQAQTAALFLVPLPAIQIVTSSAALFERADQASDSTSDAPESSSVHDERLRKALVCAEASRSGPPSDARNIAKKRFTVVLAATDESAIGRSALYHLFVSFPTESMALSWMLCISAAIAKHHKPVMKASAVRTHCRRLLVLPERAADDNGTIIAPNGDVWAYSVGNSGCTVTATTAVTESKQGRERVSFLWDGHAFVSTENALQFGSGEYDGLFCRWKLPRNTFHSTMDDEGVLLQEYQWIDPVQQFHSDDNSSPDWCVRYNMLQAEFAGSVSETHQYAGIRTEHFTLKGSAPHLVAMWLAMFYHANACAKARVKISNVLVSAPYYLAEHLCRSLPPSDSDECISGLVDVFEYSTSRATSAPAKLTDAFLRGVVGVTSRDLCVFLLEYSHTLGFLRTVVQHELVGAITHDFSNLFRTNSTSTKIIKFLMAKLGANRWLHSIFDGTRQKMYGKYFELEEHKEPEESIRSTNATRVTKYAQIFLDKLFAAEVPAPIAAICELLAVEVGRHFGAPKQRLTAVASFFLLRFVVPFLATNLTNLAPSAVSTESSVEIDSTHSANQRRGLVLVAKSIQMLANETCGSESQSSGWAAHDTLRAFVAKNTMGLQKLLDRLSGREIDEFEYVADSSSESSSALLPLVAQIDGARFENGVHTAFEKVLIGKASILRSFRNAGSHDSRLRRTISKLPVAGVDHLAQTLQHLDVSVAPSRPVSIQEVDDIFCFALVKLRMTADDDDLLEKSVLRRMHVSGAQILQIVDVPQGKTTKPKFSQMTMDEVKSRLFGLTLSSVQMMIRAILARLTFGKSAFEKTPGQEGDIESLLEVFDSVVSEDPKLAVYAIQHNLPRRLHGAKILRSLFEDTQWAAQGFRDIGSLDFSRLTSIAKWFAREFAPLPSSPSSSERSVSTLLDMIRSLLLHSRSLILAYFFVTHLAGFESRDVRGGTLVAMELFQAEQEQHRELDGAGGANDKWARGRSGLYSTASDIHQSVSHSGLLTSTRQIRRTSSLSHMSIIATGEGAFFGDALETYIRSEIDQLRKSVSSKTVISDSYQGEVQLNTRELEVYYLSMFGVPFTATDESRTSVFESKSHDDVSTKTFASVAAKPVARHRRPSIASLMESVPDIRTSPQILDKDIETPNPNLNEETPPLAASVPSSSPLLTFDRKQTRLQRSVVFADRALRLATFSDPRLAAHKLKTTIHTYVPEEWPHAQPSAESVCDAGFFWRPAPHELQDRATCFSCGKSLVQWEANDDPIREHSRIAGGRCDFVRSLESRAISGGENGDNGPDESYRDHPVPDSGSYGTNHGKIDAVLAVGEVESKPDETEQSENETWTPATESSDAAGSEGRNRTTSASDEGSGEKVPISSTNHKQSQCSKCEGQLGGSAVMIDGAMCCRSCGYEQAARREKKGLTKWRNNWRLSRERQHD